MSYGLNSYSTFSYSGSPSFAVLYFLGASLAAPPGSNLPAPAPVGRYGAWNVSASVFKTTSKQFPVRVGKSFGFLSLAVSARATGIGPTLPAYGN